MNMQGNGSLWDGEELLESVSYDITVTQEMIDVTGMGSPRQQKAGLRRVSGYIFCPNESLIKNLYHSGRECLLKLDDHGEQLPITLRDDAGKIMPAGNMEPIQ